MLCIIIAILEAKLGSTDERLSGLLIVLEIGLAEAISAVRQLGERRSATCDRTSSNACRFFNWLGDANY